LLESVLESSRGSSEHRVPKNNPVCKSMKAIYELYTIMSNV